MNFLYKIHGKEKLSLKQRVEAPNNSMKVTCSSNTQIGMSLVRGSTDMLVIRVCSTKMRDSATFSLTKGTSHQCV